MKIKFKQWLSTFHQYQQNEQPSLISNHWTKTRHMALEIHVLACDKHTNVAGYIG